MAKEHAMIESGRRQSLGKRIWKNRWVYLFLLPGIAFVLLFCYGPMYGLVVAFKDYKISKGILGSPWANPWYNNFAMMFKDKKFTAAFFNTIRMGLAYIITGFPGPIILALLLNELRSRHYKNTLQVIYTFPNFLSWVIVGGLMTTIFAGEGVINSLIRASGGQTYYSFRSAVINNIRDIIIQAVISDNPETVWNDFVNEHREEGDKLAAELTEEFLK